MLVINSAKLNPLIKTNNQNYLLSAKLQQDILCPEMKNTFITRYLVYKNEEESTYGFYTIRAIEGQTDTAIAENNWFCTPIGGGKLEYNGSTFILTENGTSHFGPGFYEEVKKILNHRYPEIPVIFN